MPRVAKDKSPAGSKAEASNSTATIGFEAKLWLTADKLRNNMDAAEPERSGDSQPQAARRASEARQYKHVVLGLIFLSRAERDNRSAAEIAPQIFWKTSRGKSRDSVTRRASRGLRVKYISDTFEEHRAKLLAGQGDYAGANAEDLDEPSGARQTATGSPKGERGGAINTKPRTSSGCPLVPAGRHPAPAGPAPSSRPSARASMTPWSPSSATTRASKASSPKTTPAPASTLPGATAPSPHAQPHRRACCVAAKRPQRGITSAPRGGDYQTGGQLLQILQQLKSKGG